jgi:hypothetical protein
VRVIIGFVGLVGMLAAALATYYVISFAVLYLVGKAFPLGGRRRQS